MKELVLCLVIVSLSLIGSSSAKLSCDCGSRNSGRIIHGDETGRNEFPWMVWLSNECGGSIITQFHILTAAHCTNRTTANELEVTVGMYSLSGPNPKASKHSVSEIIQHEGYRGPLNGDIDDISLLLLQDRVTFNKFVSPVCLPNVRYNLVGKFLKITGWGRTDGTGRRNALREVDIEVISNEKCKKSWPKADEQTQICVYTAKKDSCNIYATIYISHVSTTDLVLNCLENLTGDSGGPLVYLDTDTNRFVQVALVSYGPIKCGFKMPSVNTDIFSHIKWIKDAIKRQPQAKICTKV